MTSSIKNSYVQIAETDEDIAACADVMLELRPHIEMSDFVSRVTLQKHEGYQLAYVVSQSHPNRIVAVAGYRLGRNLAWGRFLYVDDLVTRADARSHGHGAMLLRWLYGYAKENKCDEIHLDSGVHRADAHRFYEREGMAMTSYHFQMKCAQ